MNGTLLDPREAQRRRDAGALLVDVRTPAEFAAAHAAGARNIPLDRLDPAALRDECAGRPLVLMCKGGTRSQAACRKLASEGFAELLQAAGGFEAWERAGLPAVRGRPAMSLERQVRIAAGALVAAGTALGAFVHPWFLATPQGACRRGNGGHRPPYPTGRGILSGRGEDRVGHGQSQHPPTRR